MFKRFDRSDQIDELVFQELEHEFVAAGRVPSPAENAIVDRSLKYDDKVSALQRQRSGCGERLQRHPSPF